MSRLNGNFIGMNWETLLAAKNTECEIAALQMLNNNYRNEHLQQQKPQHQAQAKSGGLTLGGIFRVPPPGCLRRWDAPVREDPGSRDSQETETPPNSYKPRRWVGHFTVSVLTSSRAQAFPSNCWGLEELLSRPTGLPTNFHGLNSAISKPLPTCPQHLEGL